jgi:pimeloyl-ACP methyl ester carboxylesterase
VLEAPTRAARLRIGEVELEVFESGDPDADRLLFLHDIDYLNGADYPFVDSLARHWRVIMPSHPGFGQSCLPESFDDIHDFAYVYLDLLRQIGPSHLLGCGFGGWIAAELAIRCTHDLKSLTLVDPLGIKVGDRTSADINDIFVINPNELIGLAWHDPEVGKQRMPLAMANANRTEDELAMLLNNRRTAALVGWNPFMHDPKLRPRLRRIDRPTLVIWGASDRIVSPSYGRAYAEAIPNARFELVEAAGHYPYIEQPACFVQIIEGFLLAIESGAGS